MPLKLPLAALLVAFLVPATGCRKRRIASEDGQSKPVDNGSLAGAPPVILWAWQTPSDLRFINPRRTGAAYLVETIHLGAEGFRVEPNLNGLEVPRGTWLMACARIETDGNPSLTLRAPQVSELAAALAHLARFPGARAVQIDFDATVSQRRFYSDLLEELRRRLPSSVPLSMTALASWCEDDDWISHLPVSEAVPMLFRMGPDGASILVRLDAGDDFHEPLCRRSTGVSTDEAVPRLPSGRRLYIFDPTGWTEGSFDKITDRIKR